MQTATLTVTEGYNGEIISSHSAFSVNIDNGTIKITPTLDALKSTQEITETLIVRTNETPNYKTASLTLKIKVLTILTFDSEQLLALGNFSNSNDDKEVKIYADEINSNNYIGNCYFKKQNNNWLLKEKLELTIQPGVNQLYFVRERDGNDRVAVVLVKDLIDAFTNKRTLNLTFK